MKNNIILRILILCLCTFVGTYAGAQITISKSSMPTSGQNIIYTTSNDSIDVTETGTNHTWDYSKINPVSQDTYKYISASKANILYALSFNGAVALDLKVANFKGAYSFYKASTTDYRQVGLGVTIPMLNIPTPLQYQEPDIIYRFPIKYNNVDSCSFLDTTTIAGLVKVKISGTRVNTVDGWGSITTPYKTYDCIRIKSVVTEVDSFAGAPIDRSRVEYKWLATTEQIPVMEAVVTLNTVTGGSTMVLTYRDSYKNIVNPNAPEVDFDVADTNVFINYDSLAFNNKTTKALAYNWTIVPNTYSFAAGTKATTKNPQVIFHKEGLYTVTLNATGPAGTGSLTKKNYINATHNSGIKPSMADFGLHIYPNPASDGIYLIANGNHHATQASITLTNIFGQTVAEKMVNTADGNTYLDLKGIASGIYFVTWKAGEEIYIEKVVVR